MHLDGSTHTLPQLLSEANYRTGLVGKAHFQPLADSPNATSLEKHPTVRDMDFWRGFNGPWYGFDHIELSRNHADEAIAGQHYGLWMEDKGIENWRDYFQPPPGETSAFAIAPGTDGKYWKRQERSWPLSEEYHYTKWTGDRSVAFIEVALEREQPFFSVVKFS